MRARGFTLLEVLIALAFAAVALIALFGAAAATVRTTSALRDRTFAHLVASNVLAELRASERWPAVGAFEGDARQAGRDWHWRVEVKATEDADVRRIELTVDDAEHERAAALAGFIGRPQPRAPAGGG